MSMRLSRPPAPRIALRLALLSLLAAGLPAQDDLEKAWRQVREELTRLGHPAEQARALQDFLDKYPRQTPIGMPLLEAEAEAALGSIELRRFNLGRARERFTTVLTHAPKSAYDLIGRALCGLAECSELDRERERALELWTQVEHDLAGTTWADIARVARTRLQTNARVSVGQPLPELPPVLDTKQTAHRLSDLQHDVALLVFFSAEDKEGMKRVASVVAAARKAGVADAQMIAFALDLPAAKPEELRALFGATTPIVASPEGFLGPAFLQLEIRGVPSTLLLGPGTTLVGRDLPPHRISELLGERGR